MDTNKYTSANLPLSFEQILWLFQQLPKKLKEQLVHQWEAEEQKEKLGIDWAELNEPLNLEEYAIRTNKIAPLKDLFADEPEAEELVKMLTS